MSALLDEGARRRKSKALPADELPPRGGDNVEGGRDLQKLVESVKRRSAATDSGGGKRRKV
jgi:hypothetical protein